MRRSRGALKATRALLLALAICVLAAAGGPVSAAAAGEPPVVAIESPLSGSESNDSTPTFAGSTSDVLDDLSVNIYAGAGIGEAGPVQTLTTLVPPAAGTWELGPAEGLPDGVYTAQATQTNMALETGKSEPVTFTVDTTSPTVTLLDPPSPSNDTNPTFTGTASDTTTVNITIYDGSEPQGTIAAATTATGTGGEFNSLPSSPALPSGQYTAIASQASSLKNPAGKSEPVTFTVDTTSPTVTLLDPPSPSNDTNPTFTGTASDTTTVNITIYDGSEPQGTIAAATTATGTGGEFNSLPSSPALPSGQYTAIASQASSLKNPAGKSEPVTFTVDTTSPTVTLLDPPSPSNDTNPTFTGTASDTTTVNITIYDGSEPQGTIAAATTATGTGGEFNSLPSSPALPSGQYTAIASQASSLKNPAGKSEPVTFTVDTTSPTVTLLDPPSPSNDTNPTFTGTASDTTTVNITIYDGSEPQGTIAAATTATGTGGEFNSLPSSPALPSGQYTAIASQASSLKNPAGKSEPVTFTVDTTSPTVTLLDPPSPSNDTRPSFTGTASDSTSVTIKVYAGATPTGAAVASASATPSAGRWSSPKVSPALAKGDHLYTAVAIQTSSLGNPAGVSQPVTFTVDTEPPQVTLNPPASPSNDTAPAFTGTASDTTAVTVEIYLGGKASGAVVATATATPGAGAEWTSGDASPTLKSGKHTYTAIAVQESSIGNPTGISQPQTFVVDSEAPTVMLDAPRSPTNDPTPTFTGIASDTTPVSVNIYVGPTAGGAVVATATAGGTGGRWTSSPASPALGDGQYTAIASQESLVAGHLGATAPATFTVDTVAPLLTLTQPADGSTTGGTTMLVSGASGEAAGDLATVTVELFAGAAIEAGQVPLQSVAVTALSHAWSATLAGLSAGIYTVRAEQADAAGNIGSSNASTFTVAAHVSSSSTTTPGSSVPLSAAFVWFPAAPHVGERVSLASTSSDGLKPITAFAWDLTDAGSFQALGPVASTTFASTGNHVVRLSVADADGRSALAVETIPVTATPLVLMQPFPLVRIVTNRTSTRTKLSLLAVQAPAGAHIIVKCTGAGCPTRSESATAAAGKGHGAVEFRRFERRLRAGARIVIRIFKQGEIGKYTRLTVRRGRPPVRVDTCLNPAGSSPMLCPAS